MMKSFVFILCMLLACSMVGCSNDKTNNNVNEVENNVTNVSEENDVEKNKENNKEEFFVIIDKKEEENIKTIIIDGISGEKSEDYDCIEKGEVVFNNGANRYKVNLPVIAGTAYSVISGASGANVESVSEIIDISYYISEVYDKDTINKSILEVSLENKIKEEGDETKNWENEWGNELKKYTEIKEENDVIAYANSYLWHSFETTDKIRVQFIKKELENNMSEDGFYLGGMITFDLADYDKAIEVVRELGNAMNYDFVKLIEEVK